MKPSRFTEEQIIAILREQEAGAATADVCRKHGLSSATFYKWKAKFGGLDVSEARRLKVLEDENAKLKKLLSEAMLDNAMLKDIASKKIVTPAAMREAVTHLRTSFEVSQRRACRVIGDGRSSVRYRHRRPDDRDLRERLRSLACKRRRFGYRRLQVILRRSGVHMNHKNLRRLYAEERLQVRRRGGHKRALGTRSLSHARAVLAAWRTNYNTVRPHSGLGNITPAAYADLSVLAMQRGGTPEQPEGYAPHPVAPPSLTGSNHERTLPITG